MFRLKVPSVMLRATAYQAQSVYLNTALPGNPIPSQFWLVAHITIIASASLSGTREAENTGILINSPEKLKSFKCYGLPFKFLIIRIYIKISSLWVCAFPIQADDSLPSNYETLMSYMNREATLKSRSNEWFWTKEKATWLSLLEFRTKKVVCIYLLRRRK